MKPVSGKCISTRVFEHVAEQIRDAIVSGETHPGERLPAQRQLAETFGVGRTTLLAALRILEESGLVVIRPGARGSTFVTVPSIEQVSGALDRTRSGGWVMPQTRADADGIGVSRVLSVVSHRRGEPTFVRAPGSGRPRGTLRH